MMPTEFLVNDKLRFIETHVSNPLSQLSILRYDFVLDQPLLASGPSFPHRMAFEYIIIHPTRGSLQLNEIGLIDDKLFRFKILSFLMLFLC